MGRLLGLGTILGVGDARGVAVAVGVGVGLGGVGVGVSVAVGVGVGVAVAVAVGVALGVAPGCAQYLPPVLRKMLASTLYPPQTTISLPVHTAV